MEAIAIVGMAVNVPRARSLDALWRNFAEGVHCIDRFEEEPSPHSGSLDAALLSHGRHVRAGGVIDDPAMFDASYFGFSRLDADLLDPQHRVFLEVAKSAIEDAALPASYLPATGVFAGCAMSSYLLTCLMTRPDIIARVGAYSLTLANDKDFLATRVSYKLGLGGPSMSVQTACSTSLVAVHLAVQSLLAGDCDTALAGGVSVRVPQRRGYLAQPDGVTSPDGECRPFDHRAAGFVPSDGAVVVVLRRLESALADRDPIRAVVLASAVKNDGDARPSFAAPSVEGQVATLSEALALSGMEPGQITHIETHGTATALGDAVEFAAINRVYGKARTACFLGAAKSNVGHLDTASGALGLVKAALSLERGVIPAVLHFSAPNPALGIERTRFRVPTEAVVWPRSECPRNAAVTSLGLGGTNAHVIISEAPERSDRVRQDRPRVYLVSARTETALDARCEGLAALVERADDETCARLAYSLTKAGVHHAFRRSLHRSHGGPVTHLTRALEQSDLVGASVAFAFTGGGAQHSGMIRGLADAEPLFERSLMEVLDVVQSFSRVDLAAALSNEGGTAEIAMRRPSTGLPAMFCVQMAIARLMMDIGVRPQALIGHSAGEYAAACIAGILSLEDAARLVVARATLFEKAPAGAMLSVALGPHAIQPLLSNAKDAEISVINGPEDVVVGGPADSIEVLQAALVAQGVHCRPVAIDVAAHTSLVAGAAEELDGLASNMRLSAPKIPLVSNLTGNWITPEDLKPTYWGTHLRHCVRFGDCLSNVLANPGTVLLDIGPGQTMSALVHRSGSNAGGGVIAALPAYRSTQDAASALYTALGKLWERGIELNWEKIFESEHLTRVAVPEHPLFSRRHWIDPAQQPVAESRRATDSLHIPYLEPATAIDPKQRLGRWLISDDGSDLARALRDELFQADCPVVCIARQSAESWAEAIEQHSANALEGVLLVWDRDEGLDCFAPYNGTAALARAVSAAGMNAPKRIVVVTRGGRGHAEEPARTPKFALARSAGRLIENEYPDISCQAFDVDAGEPVEVAASAIVDLIQRRTQWHAVIREGAVFRECFKKLAPVSSGASLPRHGVWVITGGLGAIGRTLALHLAERSAARVVLVGRRALPSREAWSALDGEQRDCVNILNEIERYGGAWEFVAGDVADPDILSAAMSRAQENFGDVYGVIHAAGIPAGGMMQLRTPADAELVLGPKVGGVTALQASLPGSVKVVVLCSALDAVLDTIGQSEHCAANSYLDALAGHGAIGGAKVFSIGWSAWRDIGQAAKASAPRQLRELRESALAGGMSAEEGKSIFDAVLASGAPRVVTSFNNIAELQGLVRRALDQSSAEPAAERRSVSFANSSMSRTEQTIASLWSDLLSVDSLSPDDDFFALGGHSLTAMQLVSRMRESFQVDVRLQQLITLPTIAMQAEHIEALLLDEVERLSEDEVDTLLGE